MLAPHIRRKVDRLWDRFWSAGLTNPLVAVEQITYLLFLKRLEEVDARRVEAGKQSIFSRRLTEDRGLKPETCRWSYIQKHPRDTHHLIDVVFRWLRTIEQRLTRHEEGTELAGVNGRMADAYFQLDPNKVQVLADAIELIDELFAAAAGGSAGQDLMGDTFEYLLSEVATAGKNGQFRTPRHIIRFMVELLAPKPGERLIDPAAGTGGFLFSSQQYQRRQRVRLDRLKLEWDGTPHSLDETRATKKELAALRDGSCFVGIDNDRTMVRIGWMNLVLHEIENPRLIQGDALSKRKGKPAEFRELLASERYDYVLANPPFTGAVDTSDLESDPLLFPRGKKKDEALTNKSELLFLWLMRDLLKVGGRCAVIVPEGVLFGNTDAHVRLRQELLTEHRVEAVISLPAGVFQPYTGVKTSILVFRKLTKRGLEGRQDLATEQVWFYEVEQDGLSLDAKRSPRPGAPNDLWDALVKFQRWKELGRPGVEAEGKRYHQPRFYKERWLADGSGRAIHEVFPELPPRPEEAESFIRASVAPRLRDLAARHRAHGGSDAERNRVVREAQKFFEPDGPALALWKELSHISLDGTGDGASGDGASGDGASGDGASGGAPGEEFSHEIEVLAREVARVDGYDVDLRSVAIDQTNQASNLKHWVVPVRAMKDGQLDPNCIEAHGWNLSAGHYRPLDLDEISDGRPATELIEELRAIEFEIVSGLDRLQKLVEERG